MSTVAVEERDWSPLRSAAAAGDYEHLRLGPLSLGPPRWRTCLGQIHLALTEAHDEVVLVDRMTVIRNRPAVDPAELMADLRHVLGLGHRHVSRVIGAGIDDDVPYVVRRFQLGRPMADVLEPGRLPSALAFALMYPIAEALAFLADAGPAPGSCCVGGFDLRDVWVGFDGGVRLAGHGTHRLRSEADGDPAQRDLSALRRLATVVGRATRTNVRQLLEEADDADEAQLVLRKADRKACGHRAELVGGWMRQSFGEAIRRERAQFGLEALH